MYASSLTRSLWKSIATHLVGTLVSPRLRAASTRRNIFITLGVICWVLLAYLLHPSVPGGEPAINQLWYRFQTLFAADVFKHILVGGFVFWLAFRAAGRYLDDIFELNNVRISERFVLQSAFGSGYDVLEIKDGDVNVRDLQSPMNLIGGPGKVRVYLENAALFEQVGGMPEVIGPTTSKGSKVSREDQPARDIVPKRSGGLIAAFRRFNRDDYGRPEDGARVIGSFERLRRVIDLRDQVQEISVSARTRDGIPVQVKNMRVIYSVRRDGQAATLETPYPFNKEAIELLVYKLTREKWTDAVAAQIKREIGAFIFRHTLSEFLAAIGRPELEQSAKVLAEVQTEADRLAGMEDDYEIDVPDPPPFVPRPGISDLFYDYSNFVARVRDKGVELRWIGIGTWDFPTDIIPERHLQAWRISYENLARGSEVSLDKLSSSSWAEEMLAILNETPIQAFNEIAPASDDQRKLNFVTLVNAYRGKLHLALEALERRDETDTPAARRIRDVWTHLAHVVSHYAGDI